MFVQTYRTRRLRRAAALIAVCVAGLGAIPSPRIAHEALIAVAANFAEVAERLEADFERDTGHQLTLTSGSTGKLYAQITNGAPFDVLLAADQKRPELLVEQGYAVPASRFTYAVGRLTLWSADPTRVAEGAATLRTDFHRLAIANPDLAPYGAAAVETMIALGVRELLRDRIVMGENIGQTHSMVATGNAELGFVARSYVLSVRNPVSGSRWDVPPHLYTPIRQDAVLLQRATRNPAAISFLQFLRSDQARAVIERFGYDVE